MRAKAKKAIKTLASAVRRKKEAPAAPALTTAEVAVAQRARHNGIKTAVKNILPVGMIRQWGGLYKDMGAEREFSTVASYLRVIVLNEAEGQPWGAIYDEAMESETLGDGEKDLLVEMVLDMQQRVILGSEYVSVAAQEKAFDELLSWKVDA